MAAEYTDCISTEGYDSSNECPTYDTKQSDGEMWNSPLLPSLPGPLWPWVVTLDRVLSMSSIELNSVPMLNWTVWNRTLFDI